MYSSLGRCSGNVKESDLHVLHVCYMFHHFLLSSFLSNKALLLKADSLPRVVFTKCVVSENQISSVFISFPARGEVAVEDVSESDLDIHKVDL